MNKRTRSNSSSAALNSDDIIVIDVPLTTPKKRQRRGKNKQVEDANKADLAVSATLTSISVLQQQQEALAYAALGDAERDDSGT
jgi:hypothetical protein